MHKTTHRGRDKESTTDKPTVTPVHPLIPGAIHCQTLACRNTTDVAATHPQGGEDVWLPLSINYNLD